MAEKETFIVGDIVYLKSGGPGMLVEEVYDKERTVGCVWFTESDELSTATIKQGLLTKKGD